LWNVFVSFQSLSGKQGLTIEQLDALSVCWNPNSVGGSPLIGSSDLATDRFGDSGTIGILETRERILTAN
jgi:hypothetical protein